MAPLFNRIIKAKQEQQGTTPNTKGNGIKYKRLQMQAQWATILQSQSEKLTIKGKKFALAAFCFLSFGYSLSLIVMIDTGELSKVFQVNSIKISKKGYQKDPQKQHSPVRLPLFRNDLDSLIRSSSGKIRYDSLLKKHQKLVDSIYQIE